MGLVFKVDYKVHKAHTHFFSFLKNIYLFFIWLHQVLVTACGIFVAACGIFSCGMQDLVPRPGIEPGSPALGVQSPNHWTTREVPNVFFIQLTHEQCEFEVHRSTNMQIFFSGKHYSTTRSELVESMDAEPQIWRKHI